MRSPCLWVTIVALVMLAPCRAFGQPSESELKALVAENLAATEADDMDRILATVHSESMSRSTLPVAMEQLQAWKLRYRATSVELIGMTGEYALARVVQQTSRVSGPVFQDNELDGIWALRTEKGKWKFWSQMVLAIRPLEP